jgi:hypothetical protein
MRRMDNGQRWVAEHNHPGHTHVNKEAEVGTGAQNQCRAGAEDGVMPTPANGGRSPSQKQSLDRPKAASLLSEAMV